MEGPAGKVPPCPTSLGASRGTLSWPQSMRKEAYISVEQSEQMTAAKALLHGFVFVKANSTAPLLTVSKRTKSKTERTTDTLYAMQCFKENFRRAATFQKATRQKNPKAKIKRHIQNEKLNGTDSLCIANCGYKGFAL